MFTARTRLVYLLPVCLAPLCLLPVFLLLVVPQSDFAGQLYTAEIPRDLPETDAWGNHPRDLYCEALEDQAEKIEVKAIEGFRACLSGATQQSWFNAWSRLCERELNQLQPAEFPLSAEVKPEAGYVPLTIAPAALARID